MSTQSTERRIPPLTLGWRLKMSLGDMKRDEMAEQLGVNPATISRWMADRGAPPKRAYLAQWSLITDTDLDWLETGDGEDDDTGPPDGGTSGSPTPATALDELAKRKRGRKQTIDRELHDYYAEPVAA